MEPISRATYLSKIWQPYPAMPSSAIACGRLKSVRITATQAELVIWRDGEFTTHFVKMRPTSVVEHLQTGDLIAVLLHDEVLLLAPCLQPSAPAVFDKLMQAQWAHFLQKIRDFFVQKKFVEIQTPTLVSCPGTEPSLDVFATEFVYGSKTKKLFLPTSPELTLKKHLCTGAEKIFELAPCFRNSEISERHSPAFLMLEWYRAFDSSVAIKKDVVDLITSMCSDLSCPPPRRVIHVSVAELFKKHCDFELTPTTTAHELAQLAKKLEVDVHSAESIDDFFFLIFMEKIENKWDPQDLVFVEKYPPYQAALARLDEQGWGDRFEVYWQGHELANAFHELNDPQVQRQRFHEDLQKKQLLNKQEIPLDEEFLKLLEMGMPPSAGIALGVERLFMSLTGIKDIRELKKFQAFDF